MRTTRGGRTLLLAAALAGGCGEAAPPVPGNHADSDSDSDAAETWFDVEPLDFVHDSGAGGRPLLPEIMCGGLALVDLDGDGDLDLYCVQAGGVADSPERPPNRLLVNRGDGTFEDRTEGSGAGDRGYGMGVAAGDADGDGDTDLYVTNLGRDTLLRNEGGGRFTDATRAAGLGDPGWGASAAFLDADGDGDLDLFVVRYLDWSVGTERDCPGPDGRPDYCSPRSYSAPTTDLLYRNEGDGTFTDVTEAAGIASAAGHGLGVVCADFDGDGRTDVFVANDGNEDRLWRNLGGLRFREEALERGCAMDSGGVAKAGMGVDAADLDSDLDPDLVVANLAEESDCLFRNDGTHFTDRSMSGGFPAGTRGRTRFGVGLRDFDHDGRLDLYVASGRVTRPLPGAAPEGDPFAEANQVFRGTGPLRFEEVAPASFRGARARTSRAAAFGDVDGDGDVDVVVLNRDAPAELWRNVRAPPGRSVVLRIVERGGGDALGAVVTMRAGDQRRRHEVRSASSYCAASDPRVHVGLGAAGGVREVEVRWTDGATERFPDVSAGGSQILRRGTGREPRER